MRRKKSLLRCKIVYTVHFSIHEDEDRLGTGRLGVLKMNILTKFDYSTRRRYSPFSAYEELKAHGTASRGLEKRDILLNRLIMRDAKR